MSCSRGKIEAARAQSKRQYHMLEVYGAMSKRRGIHDVVSSFSWLNFCVMDWKQGPVLWDRSWGGMMGEQEAQGPGQRV